MENNNKEEKLPRFENKGSISYKKDFDNRLGKSKKIFTTLLFFTIGVIISTSIFSDISIMTTIIRLLIISLIAVTYDQLLKLSWLNNVYILTKTKALEDEIR